MLIPAWPQVSVDTKNHRRFPFKLIMNPLFVEKSASTSRVHALLASKQCVRLKGWREQPGNPKGWRTFSSERDYQKHPLIKKQLHPQTLGTKLAMGLWCDTSMLELVTLFLETERINFGLTCFLLRKSASALKVDALLALKKRVNLNGWSALGSQQHVTRKTSCNF